MYRDYEGINVCVQPVGCNLALQSPPHLLNRVLSMPRIRRQVQQLNRGVLSQPLNHSFGLVDGGVVQHQHQRSTRVREPELLHKGNELHRPLALRHFVHPLTTLPLKRSEQRSLAVKSWRRYLSLLAPASQHPHRAQHRHQMHIAFVQAQNNSFFGRSEQLFLFTQPPHLDSCLRVGRQHMARSTPAIAKFPKHSPHGRSAHFQSDTTRQVSTQPNNSPEPEEIAALRRLTSNSSATSVPVYRNQLY